MTATTQINITAKDSTASAFASANRNLSELASSALKTTASLAGIGLSIAGAVESIKGIAQATIQLQQFTGTLTVGTGSAQKAGEALSFVRSESKRLGLDLATAADQFGKLAAASKGTSLEGTATRELFSAMAQASTVLGLSADKTTGALNAFQQMISKGKVQAEELRGQLGERLPGAFQMAARAMGVTTAELDKLLTTGKVTAEELLPKLTVELNKTFGDQAEESAKNLQAQINRMNTALFEMKIAIGESGLINFLSSGIELATKLTNKITGIFGGGEKPTAIQNQANVIQSLEDQLTRMKGLNDVVPFFSDFIFSKKDQDELKYRLENAREELNRLKAVALIPVPGGKPTLPAQVAEDSKKATDAAKELKKRQDFLLDREREYIKLLEIERKAQADLVKPYLDSAQAADKKLTSMVDEIEAMKLARSRQISLEEAINLTTIARLEEKKAIAKDSGVIAQLDAEIATRKELSNIIPEFEKLRVKNKSTTDEVSQLWIQAGRNIQSSLANSIFDFFTGGLNNMVSSAKNAVLRIASEFAALKISRAIGFDNLFTDSSANSRGLGAGRFLDMASLGSNAMGLLKSGFGATSLLSSVGSKLPGSIGSFFGGIGVTGTQAAAEAGATALWGASGASTAASMGSSFAAAAGPAIALFAVDAIGRLFGGNKKLGGAEMIPVIGGFLAGLFGRGPLKQKETQLTGDVGLEGLLSGYLTTNFKAKGGLLVGSKRDFAGVNLLTGAAETDNKKLQGVADSMLPYAGQLANTLKDSVAAIVSQVKDVSGALDISIDPLKDFKHQINLISESGKALTDEQISGEITKISDEMVTRLMPSITQFSKSGETALQTFTRLGNEFKLLEQAAVDTGLSLDQAKAAIQNINMAARSTFIDQLGGFDAASQKINYFADNFLTDAEKVNIMFSLLDPEMRKLGFSASITHDQFKELTQSVGKVGGITVDQYAGLLNLAEKFNQFDTVRSRLSTTTETVVDSESKILDIRQQLTSAYQKERGEIQSTIDKFKQFATQLKGARDSLLLGNLSPLTPGQRLEEARNQLNQARLQANAGDQNALSQLPQIAQNFLQASQVANASGAAYQSDFQMVQNILQNAERSALSQIDVAQSQLNALDSSVKNLIDIKDSAKTTNDLLRELKIAVLSGNGNPAISTDTIKAYLAANPGITPEQLSTVATQYGVSWTQLAAAGYNVGSINKPLGGASVTDQQINAFVKSASSVRDVYNFATQNGISSSRMASVTGVPIADIQKWVKDNNLPSFAVGTDFVSKTGLAMVHRAEAIVPSSAIDEIKKLREELAKLREEQNRQTGDLINVIDITNRQNAEAIAKANRDASKDQQWSDRSKAALA